LRLGDFGEGEGVVAECRGVAVIGFQTTRYGAYPGHVHAGGDDGENVGWWVVDVKGEVGYNCLVIQETGWNIFALL